MMLRKYFILFILLSLSNVTFGQEPMEWIDSNETYLKLNISKSGIYNLYLSDLDSALLGQLINSNEFPHMLYHGKEVPLKLSTDEKGPFLTFYAEKNRGLLDSLVYPSAVERANPYVPLFSESSPYFLYWDHSPNKTWKITESDTADQLGFVQNEKLLTFDQQYSFNNSIGLLPQLQQSYYEYGEGWTGPFLSMDSTYTVRLPLENKVQSLLPISLEFQVNGRSRVGHKLLWYIDGILQQDTLRIDPFGFVRKEVTLDARSSSNEISITFEGLPQTEFDWYSMTYFKWTYPSLPILEDGASFETNQVGNHSFDGAHVIGFNSLWDYYEVNGQSKTLLANQAYKYFSEVQQVLDFELFVPREFDVAANYIIVTAISLADGANEFATYRSSEIGGSFKTDVIFTKDIYNHFAYGERTPTGITNYAKWLLSKGVDRPYLFLLGRAVSFPDVLKQWEDRDLVPTMGYPASDALLTAGLNDRYGNDVQALATGRLNVTTNQQISNYLSKVKEHELTVGNKEWQKRFLHLSGGKTTSELEQLSRLLSNLEPIADSSLWRPTVEVFRKKTLEEVEPIDISQEVNNGVGMITFAGHGSANVLDLNIGYADTPESGLANKGKYPIMYFNGCGVGNVFYRYDPLSTDWLLAKDRGAIAVFANSFWSYLFSSEVFLQSYYESFLKDSSSVDLRIGQIHQEINQKMTRLAFNPFIKANIHQVVLQGDPALRFFDISTPDYYVDQKSIFIKSKDENASLASSSDFQLSFEIGNAGRIEKERTLNFVVSLVGPNGSTQLSGKREFNQSGQKYFIDIPAGVYNSISIELNPEKLFQETNFENNLRGLVIENWEVASRATAWPACNIVDKLGPTLWVKIQDKFIPDGDLVVPNANIEVYLRDENPVTLGKENFEIRLTPCESCEEGIVSESDVTISIVDDYTLNASFRGPIKQGIYTLEVLGNDEQGNFSTQKLTKSFEVSGNKGFSTFEIYPNPAEEFTEIRYFLNDFNNPISSEIHILDIKGKLLSVEEVEISVGSNSHFLNTSHLPAGTYELRLVQYRDSESDWSTKRLIKR